MAFLASFLRSATGPWRLLAAAGLVALTGCHSPTIDAQAYQDSIGVQTSLRRAEIWPRCPDPSHPLGFNCGLLSERLRSEEFLREFEKKHCADLTPDECQARHERYYAAFLRERYFAADAGAVEHTCDLAPGSCDDPVAYEMLLLRSHNERVRSRAAQIQGDIEHERVEAHQRENEENARLVDATVSIASRAIFGRPRCTVSAANARGEKELTCDPGALR